MSAGTRTAGKKRSFGSLPSGLASLSDARFTVVPLVKRLGDAFTIEKKAEKNV